MRLLLRVFRGFSALDIRQIFKIYEESLTRNYSAKEPWESPEILFLEDLRLFFGGKNNRLFLWEHAGEFVSALRLEPYQDGFLISCLETAPDQRRSGFALELMNAVVLLEKGPFYAHVAKNNVPSRRFHEKVGFVKIADHAVFVDGSVYSSVMTLKMK